MQINNVQYHPDIPWEDYLKLPGYSFSGLKNQGVDILPSEGIAIGKLVHTYLLKPKEYNYERHEIVIPIARELVKYYNSIIRFAEVEVGVTSNFCVDGLCMPHKGLADMAIRKHLIVDYKILAGDLQYYLKTFLYAEQLRGYMLPFEAPIGLIIAYNKRTKKVQREVIGQDPRWWIYKIKQYGKPILQRN